MVKPFYFKLLSIFAISCLGVIVYSDSFYCSFHFDDIPYILNNPHIRNIYDLSNIWAFFPCRFLTFFSLAFNYHFNGLHVWGYHLFNIAVHVGCALLVWWLVLLTLSTPVFEEIPAKSMVLGVLKEEKITRHAPLIALFAGLVFVSHPVQVEAVTYIWQRAASMAAFFYLASLCLYVKSRLRHPHARWQVYYIFALVTVVLAMFTKENSITLPLMVVLYEFSFFKGRQRLNWKYLFAFLLTLLVIPVTMLLTQSVRFQEIQGVVEGPGGMPPLHYFLTQLRVIMTYIRLAFLPLNLNLDYDYPIFKSIFEMPVLISLFSLIAILFLAKRMFSKYRLMSFSIFWFFLTLLPESSFLPQKDVIFEHRLYLPLVGYSMFLACGAYYLLGRTSFKVMMAALMLVVVCYSVMTYQRNKVWRDEFTLWNDTVQKSSKARAYNNRGSAYDQRGKYIQAMSDYNKAIEIDPNYAETYINRGNFYDKQGKLPQAMADFTKAIELNPKFAEAYNNRGNVYADQGHLPQAISDYTKAIEIDPAFGEAYNNRGTTYGQQGKLDQAIVDFTKAIELNHKFAEAYYNRGFAYYYEKKYDKAWADTHKVEELGVVVNPDFINELKKASDKDK